MMPFPQTTARYCLAAFGASALTCAAAHAALAGQEEDQAEGKTENKAPAGEASTDMSKGEQKLAKLLAGREKGKPVSCISLLRGRDDLKIIDDTALVYGRGKTIYVNYTRDPSDIDDRDVLVTRRFGARICKSDIVTKIDPSSRFYSGNVFLADFIPYTRTDRTES